MGTGWYSVKSRLVSTADSLTTASIQFVLPAILGSPLLFQVTHAASSALCNCGNCHSNCLTSRRTNSGGAGGPFTVGDVLAKTQKKLKEASDTIDAAQTRTNVMARRLKSVEGLSDTRTQALLPGLDTDTAADEDVS